MAKRKMSKAAVERQLARTASKVRQARATFDQDNSAANWCKLSDLEVKHRALTQRYLARQ